MLRLEQLVYTPNLKIPRKERKQIIDKKHKGLHRYAEGNLEFLFQLINAMRSLHEIILHYKVQDSKYYGKVLLD